MLQGTLEKLETSNPRTQDPDTMLVTIPHGIRVGSSIYVAIENHEHGGILTSPVEEIIKDSEDEIIFRTKNTTYRLSSYVRYAPGEEPDDSMLSQL